MTSWDGSGGPPGPQALLMGSGSRHGLATAAVFVVGQESRVLPGRTLATAHVVRQARCRPIIGRGTR